MDFKIGEKYICKDDESTDIIQIVERQGDKYIIKIIKDYDDIWGVCEGKETSIYSDDFLDINYRPLEIYTSPLYKALNGDILND